VKPRGRGRRRAGPVRVVLVTAPSRKAAGLARALVQRRLAACASLVPGMRSVYRWKGRVEEAGETLIVLKTAASRVPALLRAIADLHPYEVPEAIVLLVEGGLGPYLDWVRAGTARAATRRG